MARSAYETRFIDLARGLGSLGAWVRLHYVYPYPHVDAVIPLMAEGRVLPYLDVPFQHGSPSVLKRMRRPAHAENTLARIQAWRALCPRARHPQHFHRGLSRARPKLSSQSCSIGWTRRSLIASAASNTRPVEGATANALPDHVPAPVQEERYARFMEKAGAISAARLKRRVGSRMRVLVDAIEDDTAIASSAADAPEIDGVVRVAGARTLAVGSFADVKIVSADAYDLRARLVM